MNRTCLGGVVALGALVHACSGGDQGRHETAARVQARAISGPPAISAPIALDTGTVDWSWSQQSAYLLMAISDLDEHLLVYSVSGLAGSRVLGVPIRDGEADAAFVLAGQVSHVTRMPTAWLSVYSAGSSSWSVVATEAGERTEPVLLPLPCSAAGVAWGTDLALVTDSCGNGLMLDADGEPVGDPFPINGVSDDYYYCYYYGEDYYCYGYPDVPIYGGNVAFNGEYFLTAYGWLDPNNNTARTALYSFSADGTFTDEGSAGVGTFYDEEAAYPFGLVSNGSSFLQLIEVGRSSYMYRTNLAFVVSVTDGTVSVDDAAAVGTGVACDSFEPSDQAAYALALADDYGFVRRDPDGESTGLKFSELDDCGYGYPVVLDVFPSPVATSTADAVLLAQGTSWFRYDPFFVPLDAAPHTAQLQAPLHSAPAAVHTPVGYFAGWLERTTDPTRSLGRHVTELGAIVEDEPIALRTAASGTDKLVFASDGTRALAVLANEEGTHIDLVDDAGVVTAVTSAIEATPTLAGSHSATADADGFLLAWLASGGYQAMKVDSEGSAGTPFSIGPVSVDSSATASTYDGANDVVVWTAEASTTTRTLYGVRIDPTGSVLDDPPVPILTYPSDAPAALGSNVGPSLTRTSDGLVVAWTEHDGTGAVFRAQRLAEDLSLVGAAGDVAEVQQANPAAASASIAAAWDGESLWFVWLSATTTPFATVWGRRLTATLEPADEEPFIIDEDAYSDTPAALTPSTDGQLLVAYGNPTLEGVELHIEGRLLSSLGLADGTPCSEDSACASGACEAGACGPEGSGVGGSTTDGSGGSGPGIGGSTTDGSGGSTTDGSGIGGSPSNGGSAGSTGSAMGGSTTGAATTSHGGAASGGSHAGSSGSAGEGAQGGSSPTGGATETTNTSMGGSDATTGGGGHDGGDCSCSAPGRASHTNLASLVMLAAVALGRRRPRTPARC